MVTSTKGMNDTDYRGELGSRLKRAKEIAREAIKMYEKEGTEEAKAIAERAVKTARGLNSALTGPSPDLAGGPQSPSQGIVQQMMAPYQQYAESRLAGEPEPPKATTAAEVNPNAMVQSDMLGNSPDATTPVDFTLPEQPVNSPYANADLGGTMMDGLRTADEKIGAAVSGFTDMASLGWGDELYSYINEKLFGVAPEESRENYVEYQEGVQQDNPVAAGFGQAVGVVAGAKALPSYSGIQSPLLQGAAQGATYVGISEAGEAAEGEKLWEGTKGALTGGLYGGIINKTITSLMPLADKAKNFRLKAALKKAEKQGTIESLKNVEKAAYDSIPKGTNLFDDVAPIDKMISTVKKDSMYTPIKGAPTNVEKAEAMIQSVTKNGTIDMHTYKNLRTNLHRLADDSAEGLVVKKIIGQLDDLAVARMGAIGDTSMLAAREATTNLRKASLFDDAFNEAKIAVNKLGQKADPLIIYRNTAERILKSPDAKFLSDTERKLVEQFITGGGPVKRLEGMLASMSPSSSNFWAMAHVAGAIGTGNPLMLLTMAVTEGSRFGLNKSTVAEAEKLVKQLGGLEVVTKNMNDPVMVRTLAAFGYDMTSLTDMLFPEVKRSQPK